ncbi:hypothetical protein [Leifsonia sp. Leaf264]|uniref:hypothetical protein n=1 Tax=Leifsonia sp. Leaf264 TaxID=1736314 RepID=UPI0006F94116|nr:hypothetical protein [Leifsonia sp. Leaf264]KQO98677.1 hypothetical protein ASF30_11485 [Leifsonia sp. Leaf264]
MTQIALHADRLSAVEHELSDAAAGLSAAGSPSDAANLAMLPATLRLDRAIAGLAGELGRVGSSFAAETGQFDTDLRASAADMNTVDEAATEALQQVASAVNSGWRRELR